MNILFRAWDNKEKVMLYPSSFSSSNGCDSSDGQVNRRDKHSIMTWDGNCYEDGMLQDYILQMYIGLTDKNGKKCFDGDIVKFRYSTGDQAWDEMTDEEVKHCRKMEGREYIGVVKWDKVLAGFKIIVGKEDVSHIIFPACYVRDGEVIGDVFNDKDLL